MVAGGFDFSFCRVGVEGGSQIDKGEAHSWNSSSIVLASVPVAHLMQAQHNDRQQIEFNDVEPGLVVEVVELQSVAPDFRPMRDGNTRAEAKNTKRQQREPAGIEKARVSVNPGEELVGIKGGKQNQRQVAVPALCLLELTSFICAFLYQRDIFFLSRLIPEVDRIELFGEFANLLRAVMAAGLPGIELRDFLKAMFAIKQLDESPIPGRKFVHVPYAWNIDANCRLAVFYVLSRDDVGVHAGSALR